MHLGPGTRALVTGTSRGIGRALAERLAARGATVGLAARSARELEALADALPGEHAVLPMDVGDRASVEAAVERFGRLDLLVANAGVAHYEPFAEQPVEHFEEMTRVNWLGTLYTISAALPALLRQGSGHVVVVSSGAGLRAFPQAAVYGATKAAQRAFADALRHELTGTGVSLTTVHPGEVATSLHEGYRGRMPAWSRASVRAVPAHRLADRILRAVERDERQVFYPPVVRLLGVVNGISPAAADAMLRRLRGPSAAPRRG
ncbi:MAG TPA: SDR family NAD(P)-dependent oxidoreductase [Solirubrobacteraceae bacterium]|nr:SDR family NAD(P)-dependent oxidoreductase [Solirubrobacteraceae bacterium]